jgi:uncharacterized protein (DUF305 family)
MLPTNTTDPSPRTALHLALAGAAMAALTGLAGCANNDMSGMDHGSGSSASAAPSASTPSAASTPADGPRNDADVMFASMMIPHHQQAIEMSDMALTKDGIDASVTDLAQQIKDAQAPEIAQMQGWLAGWDADPGPTGMSDMDHGGDGTMSEADMDALDQATGSEAARLFLTGMVKHHQGAITMAQEEVANGENPDAKKLADSIITSQQAEIEKMNTLLESL